MRGVSPPHAVGSVGAGLLIVCVSCGMHSEQLGNWERKAAENAKAYRRFLEKADRRQVLPRLPDLHEEAFRHADCLSCANCCRNYSPRFKTPDIKRLSRALRMREGVFIETYLRLDEDGDYVVKSTPCPFLGADNRCSVYEDRPSDCRRFPYTDEDVLVKRPAITLKNASFCPAVHWVLERLMAPGR
jgi:Fe-S-cluster containining protein